MTKKIDKYEQLYRNERDVCGPPFPQFVEFFDSFDQQNCRVLDLGCGQGRDALFIARKGHTVLGVDLSETGIFQMLMDARKESLSIEGVVADIVEFEPSGEFDVILFDRVLHMLRDDDDRIVVLETICQHTKPHGFVLIADMPKNMDLLVEFFERKQGLWNKRVQDKGILFFQKGRI